jgi:hypothetical protein
MTRPGEFHPIHYDAQRMTVPGEIRSENQFPEQALKFRLQMAPALAPAGDASNISLLRAEPAFEIQPPDNKALLPGSLIQRFQLAKPLDLTRHRALAVRLDAEAPATGEVPVLNIQLEAAGQVYRDYYVDLDFSGPKTVILSEPGTNRTLAEFRPASANYPFKAAMGNFNYGNVVAVNLRWMRYPKGGGARCRVGLVEALEERDNSLRDIEISDGLSSITVGSAMKTGDYAEYWDDGRIRVFDRNGVTLSTSPVSAGPQLRMGENKLTVRAAGSGDVVFTAITLGK